MKRNVESEMMLRLHKTNPRLAKFESALHLIIGFVWAVIGIGIVVWMFMQH